MSIWKDILLAMGAFLKQFGTAIYNTRAWAVYGEGPTKMGGGSFQQPIAGTPNDLRYTASKDGDAVYAILLGWPGNGRQVTLASVTPSRFAVGSGKVFLFGPVGGTATSLAFTQDASGLRVTLPSAQPYTAVAYAMKIRCARRFIGRRARARTGRDCGLARLVRTRTKTETRGVMSSVATGSTTVEMG